MGFSVYLHSSLKLYNDTENDQRQKLSYIPKLKLVAYCRNLWEVSMKSNNGAGF